MVSTTTLAATQAAVNQVNLLNSINQLLAEYGLTLPTAADQSTGLLTTGQVNTLTAAIQAAFLTEFELIATGKACRMLIPDDELSPEALAAFDLLMQQADVTAARLAGEGA